ncbi:MAG: hypothetical protein HQK63_14320 [Desulfamplus sp.]|nr:hypothetical protein [Desulfamplus sp.]
MSDTVIKVENLGKKYTIGHQIKNGNFMNKVLQISEEESKRFAFISANLMNICR